MNVLEIKFLGLSYIKLNSVEIHLPFAKAEYIIYLLAHEKNITRDKLCALLWGDVKEEVAKKSLRNAVYTIRKNLYDDIILSPKRFLLQIDENCEIVSDIHMIKQFTISDKLDENKINNFIDIYDGDFLEQVENTSVELESLITVLRNEYKNLFTNKLKEIIPILLNKSNYVLGEKCCKKLIELDEFDELGYKYLMKIYFSLEKFGEAINIYNVLEKTLRENLSVKPSEDTWKMFDSIIKKQILEKTENNKTDFYGREKEIELLKNNFINFISNKSFNSYIILGEAGIGKTSLIDRSIHYLQNDFFMIRTTCYEAESEFMFKLWDKIFERLSYIIRDKNINIPTELIKNINKFFPTFKIGLNNYEECTDELNYGNNNLYIEKYISDLFAIISKKQKIVFVIDDFNWADKNSLELLCKIIFSNRYNMMILASCRTENMDYLDKFYFHLCPNNNIGKIALERFTFDESKELINIFLPEYSKYHEVIYKESEGNPLFITEMINSLKQGMNIGSITDKMATLMYSRIIKLSDEARKLLTICSMFYEVFNIKMLSKITNVSNFKLVELNEELLANNILKEINYADDKYGLIFTHQKIREYVYSSVSKSKRIVLHESLGEYYETMLKNNKIDRVYYANLIYHFNRSDNMYKVFKYEIKNMQVIFDVSHEIFPILEDEKYTGVFEYHTDEKLIDEKFEKLNKIYNELNFDENNEMYELQIIYLYLHGRFNKDIGDPAKCLDSLMKMIELSTKKGYYDYAYEGYLQLIQYAININDLIFMKSCIENAEKLCEKNNDIGKCSIILRYKGYYYILKGYYEDGEKYILEAVEKFNLLRDRNKYILNIAACYFYLGEGKRLEIKYAAAVEYYEKAFELCDEDEDFPAIALILSKIGYIKYEIEVYDEALFYLLKSLKAYDKTIFAWGRAEVYYYLALIYDKKGMKEKSRNYIKGAISFCDKYYNNDLSKKAENFLENLIYNHI